MKKIIVILVILILLFGGFSVWAVNTYAKPLEIEDLKAVVVPDEGGVFLQSDEGAFQKITEETDLKVGDTVKTDETGSARIVLYDTNEVTLDNNSEVTIEESFIDKETPFLTKIKLNLKQGQVWNRLLELFHPDAYFKVESGGIVATVRGTIFNISNFQGDIDIAVLENSVVLTQVGEAGAMQTLKADEKLFFDSEKLKNLQEAKIEKITRETKEGEWFKKNFLRDSEFKKWLEEKKDSLISQVGPLPGERFYSVKQLGEKISLLLTFDKAARQKKMENFAARKIFAAQLLAEQGDRAGALRLIKSLPKTPVAAKRLGYYDRDFLKMQVGILKSNVSDKEFAKAYLRILEQRELDFLNQKVEVGGFLPAWLKTILKSGPEGTIPEYPYLRLTAEDWDCLNKIQEKSLEMQKIVEGATPEDLVQWSATMRQLFTSEDFACIQRIQAKLIMPRTEDLMIRPLDLENTNVETNTNTEVAPAQEIFPVSLSVEAASQTIAPQAKTPLSAFVLYSDNSIQNVTRDTRWQVMPSPITGVSFGEVRDGVFYSNGQSGEVIINAFYTDPSGTSLESSVTIIVGN